jgi:hypothetical protein
VGDVSLEIYQGQVVVWASAEKARLAPGDPRKDARAAPGGPEKEARKLVKTSIRDFFVHNLFEIFPQRMSGE